MATSPPGGFLRPTLPSPAPTPSTYISSPSPSSLPVPRKSPLRAGSAKEETLRRYVDTKLLLVSRRYVKKFMYAGGAESSGKVESRGEDEKDSGVNERGEVVAGYTSMKEVCTDLGALVDVLWLSGTPTLQIPYLLNIALSLNSYLPSFPPSPTATFTLLHKLDHTFSSLITGTDVDSGAQLPGFHGTGIEMSKTDMVRLRSVVQGTRVKVVEVMHGDADEDDERRDVDMGGAETDGEGEGGWDGMEEGEDEERLEMDTARVYHRTIEVLERVLGDGKAFHGAEEG